MRASVFVLPAVLSVVAATNVTVSSTQPSIPVKTGPGGPSSVVYLNSTTPTGTTPGSYSTSVEVVGGVTTNVVVVGGAGPSTAPPKSTATGGLQPNGAERAVAGVGAGVLAAAAAFFL